jgi:RNA polymerase sigma-70 factor (ECF subfamily)
MDDQQAGEDRDLIFRAQQGSLDAFNVLILKYQNLSYNHAYSLLGNHQSAEDAAQESMIKAFNKIEKFHGPSFRNWLLTIVANTSLDELRRLKRHPADPLYPEDENGEDIETPLWLVDPNYSAMAMLEQKEIRKTLSHDLNELAGIYRSAITLIDLYEYDYSEAAFLLRIPLGTLKSRLIRGRLQMRRMFEINLGPSPNFAIF